MPSNSVEFEVLTTKPTWSQVNGNWELFTQDMRLSNISPKLFDIHYIWDRFELSDQIMNLRNGRFNDAAKAIAVVGVSMLEVSQGINGFVRKNARSVHSESSSVFREDKKGGFNPFSMRS